MKIADGELRQILTYDVKIAPDMVRELVADSKQTGDSLLRTVLRSHVVDEAALAKAQAKRLGVPFIDLDSIDLKPKIVQGLPREIAAKHHVICFDQTATGIKLAMADPRDERARQAVKDYTHKTVRRYQATSRQLARAMRAYTTSAPLPLSSRDLISTILQQALANDSRDIHFEVHDQELSIKRRHGKSLVVMSTLPASRLHGLIGWCKLQIQADLDDTSRPQHGRFSISVDGLRHDVLMSTIPVIGGEKMVLRIVPSANSLPSFKDLGYSRDQAAQLKQYVRDGAGLMVIAGGNNSDTSTTLAALAAWTARQPHTDVTTIEQPVTYQIPGSNQIEVTTSLPFEEAISSAISQGPSTIVTSQLGTGRTAEQLIDFALTQHLVMSGLYATNTLSALTRIMSYPLAPALLAASLRTVVVQHRIPTLCTNCRVHFTPTGPLKTALWKQFSFSDSTQIYRTGVGCDSCDRGNTGTVMLADMVPVNPELQQLLATGADKQALLDYLDKDRAFAQELGKLASAGKISIDEAGRLTARQ